MMRAPMRGSSRLIGAGRGREGESERGAGGTGRPYALKRAYILALYMRKTIICLRVDRLVHTIPPSGIIRTMTALQYPSACRPSLKM